MYTLISDPVISAIAREFSIGASAQRLKTLEGCEADSEWSRYGGIERWRGRIGDIGVTIQNRTGPGLAINYSWYVRNRNTGTRRPSTHWRLPEGKLSSRGYECWDLDGDQVDITWTPEGGLIVLNGLSRLTIYPADQRRTDPRFLHGIPDELRREQQELFAAFELQMAMQDAGH